MQSSRTTFTDNKIAGNKDDGSINVVKQEMPCNIQMLVYYGTNLFILSMLTGWRWSHVCRISETAKTVIG